MKKRGVDTELGFQGESLLRGICNGEHDAFTLLYKKSFHNLVLTAKNYVKDDEVSKEIVQTIFLRLLESPPNLVNTGALKSYLHRSAINHAINHLRRKKRLEEHHSIIAQELLVYTTESNHDEVNMKVHLRNAIESLPPQCQRVLKMSRFQNLKYKEIAEQLGIAEKTVENHIVSAFRHLRKRLSLRHPGNHQVLIS